MRALFLADEKPSEPLHELAKDCEIIILLGDLFYEWIKELENISIPILGVTGNHDFDTHMNPNSENPLEKIGATQLHLDTFEYRGVRFAGFSGDLSYIFAENNKPYWKGNDPDILKDELKKMETLESADVLLTHFPSNGTLDMPKFLGRKGLQTFRNYIDRVKPKYHFHGHMHVPCTAQVNQTEVNCVFPYLIKDI
jgi:uncharacterized protein